MNVNYYNRTCGFPIPETLVRYNISNKLCLAYELDIEEVSNEILFVCR